MREEAQAETQANIDAFRKISEAVDRVGVDRIDEIVSEQNGISAQNLVLSMLK